MCTLTWEYTNVLSSRICEYKIYQQSSTFFLAEKNSDALLFLTYWNTYARLQKCSNRYGYLHTIHTYLLREDFCVCSLLNNPDIRN